MQIEQTALDNIRARPRFKIITDISREDYAVLLKNFLREKSAHYSGSINSETAIISVKSESDTYWKPCLSLRTEHDEEENKTVIRGVFGPTSAVWTFFMFLYFIFSILWMVFITVWFVEKQINSHDFPWAFSASLVTLLCLAATYAATRYGQYKAKLEMQKLREFAEESILTFES
ncbi:hypothetical protein KSK37_08005 [Kaistella sp. DKR-2]|uniref:hypothetical protein n=1 Tax=Kaistella soli TaxID=2849654 RepID=UPI001C25BE50|nr:hypothetical protein [Kaistella soli]MBU8883021.1 hypothetical protein [Kaistella soli]